MKEITLLACQHLDTVIEAGEISNKDTVGAIRYLSREIREIVKENDTLRHEFKMAQASMPEVKDLREEIAKLEYVSEHNGMLCAENSKLRERIEKLRIVLIFYSDKSNWVSNSGRIGVQPCYFDFGEQARECLSQDDELERS